MERCPMPKQASCKSKKLGRAILIIPSEAISAWIEKGEVVDRYFNPKDQFQRVYFLLRKGDAPDLTALKRMSGNATIKIRHYDTGTLNFIKSLGWKDPFFGATVKRIIKNLPSRDIDIIRIIGADLNLVIGNRIARELNAHSIVSLHKDYELALSDRPSRIRERLKKVALTRVFNIEIPAADYIWVVYSSIGEFLSKKGISNWELVPNLINSRIARKKTWSSSGSLRMICVSKFDEVKDPREIVKALVGLDNFYLVIVGDGPLFSEVKHLIRSLDLVESVILLGNISNDDLLKYLANSDLCLLHSAAREFSKVFIEASLTGLPIIMNQSPNKSNPDYAGLPVVWVNGNSISYSFAIRKYMKDRATLDKNGKLMANLVFRNFDPNAIEEMQGNLYHKLICGP